MQGMRRRSVEWHYGWRSKFIYRSTTGIMGTLTSQGGHRPDWLCDSRWCSILPFLRAVLDPAEGPTRK